MHLGQKYFKPTLAKEKGECQGQARGTQACKQTTAVQNSATHHGNTGRVIHITCTDPGSQGITLFLGRALTFCFPVSCNRLFSFGCKQQLIRMLLFLSSIPPALPLCDSGLQDTAYCSCLSGNPFIYPCDK